MVLDGSSFLPSLMDFANVCLDMFAKMVSNMTVPNNSAISAGESLRLPPPYPAYQYIRRWPSPLDSHPFTIIPDGSTRTLMFVGLEFQTAVAGWQCRRKHWGRGWLALDDHTQENFMNMPLVRPVDDVRCEN